MKEVLSYSVFDEIAALDLFIPARGTPQFHLETKTEYLTDKTPKRCEHAVIMQLWKTQAPTP